MADKTARQVPPLLARYFPDEYTGKTWRTCAKAKLSELFCLDQFMAVNLPLHEMSVEEKLQVMETIWADLSQDPDRLESPSWHKDVLEDTEKRVESGEAVFSDWEKAKTSIRDRLR